MTLSNYITYSRIVLSALLVVLLQLRTLASFIIALIVFVLASLTDYWDGLVARRRGETSSLGAFLDPLADKCLVLTAFWSFVLMRLVPAWMVVIITLREVVMTLARTATLSRRSVAAIASGKQKAALQMVTAIVILLMLVVAHAMRAAGAAQSVLEWPSARTAIWLLMCWTTAVTVISGLHLAMQWKATAAHQESATGHLAQPAVFISTLGGAGFVPAAPGLAGSILGLGIAYLWRSHPWLVLLQVLVGCGVAGWAITRAERALNEEDAPAIIVDEALGMLVALWAVPWRWPYAIAGLVLFRVLDVVKPWGVRRLERLPSPWGVLVDDLACGVLVNVVLQVWLRSVVR